MSQTERNPAVLAMEQRAQVGLDRWIRPHLNHILEELPYNPGNENQWIDRIELGPNPSLERARYFGEKAMGAAGYESLIDSLHEQGVIETGINNSNRGISTLIATLHLPNTLDTALTHNASFVAADNPEFADINVVLSNFIMSRIKIMGVDVDEVLRYSGRQIRAFPEGAKRYIDSDIIEYVGRIAVPKLAKVLKEGVVLHRALSGTSAKKIVQKDGSSALMVPMVQNSVAFTTIKRSPQAVGVPMNVRIGNTRAHVFPVRNLKEIEDVHRLMGDMVEIVNEQSDEPVFYGLPAGAQES